MLTPNQNLGLSQRQQQTHTITPQLQQAIKLLALSNLELTEFVNEQLEENPFLDLGDTTDSNDAPAISEDTPPTQDAPSENTGNQDLDTHIDNDFVNQNSIDAVGTNRVENPEFDTLGKVTNQTGDVDEANIDQSTTTDGNDQFSIDSQSSTEQWSTLSSGGNAQTRGDDELDMIGTMTASTPSLYDIISDQISIAFSHNEDETYIAYALLDEISEDGYLRINISDFADDNMLSEPHVQHVLKRLQQFEPTGIFAQSLGQCFALQLDEMGELTQQWEIFLDNLPLIQQGKHKRIMKLADINEDQFRTMVKRLKSLDPKPAQKYNTDDNPPVIPDVFLRKLDSGDYHIELNSSTLPRVIVNERFYSTVKSGNNTDEDKLYYSEQINTANWLVKAVHQRAITITKVVTAIVTRQKEFFDKGIMHLKPMTLKDIADDIGMHESTVSRVTSNKFIYSDKGIFEFKYFFSTALSSGDGDVSAEAIRHQIKDILNNETIDHIYSDEELATILQNKGINVARRTVAKYREELDIPSSSKRRKQLKLSTIVN